MAPSIATAPIVPSKAGTISTPLPNPSLQVTADHQLKQVDALVYAPRRGEVLLQIKATGICGYVKGRFTWGNIYVDSLKDQTFTSGKPGGFTLWFSKMIALLGTRQPASSCSVVTM